MFFSIHPINSPIACCNRGLLLTTPYGDAPTKERPCIDEPHQNIGLSLEENPGEQSALRKQRSKYGSCEASGADMVNGLILTVRP